MKEVKRRHIKLGKISPFQSRGVVMQKHMQRIGFSVSIAFLFKVTLTHVLQKYRRLCIRVRKLKEALTQKLSLVSASAGFGKTTLVSQHLAQLDRLVALERAQYKEALGLLEQAEALDQTAIIPVTKYRWYVAMALLKQAQGEFKAALTYLPEAEFWYIRGPISNFRSFSAMKARIYLQQGQL